MRLCPRCDSGIPDRSILPFYQLLDYEASSRYPQPEYTPTSGRYDTRRTRAIATVCVWGGVLRVLTTSHRPRDISNWYPSGGYQRGTSPGYAVPWRFPGDFPKTWIGVGRLKHEFGPITDCDRAVTCGRGTPRGTRHGTSRRIPVENAIRWRCELPGTVPDVR